ncbi:MAG: regulator [Streptosporangiaceae bacterium]|nr:regulator [Streptosporangiaceae bacterium]
MLTSGGLMLLDTGGHRRALTMFTEAAALFRQAGDEKGFARTHNYAGLAHLGMGALEQAGRSFEDAITACARIGERRTAALARLNAADTDLASRRYDRALGQATIAHRTLTDEQDVLNAASGDHARPCPHRAGPARHSRRFPRPSGRRPAGARRELRTGARPPGARRTRHRSR